jgi:hypothetical protein
LMNQGAALSYDRYKTVKLICTVVTSRN